MSTPELLELEEACHSAPPVLFLVLGSGLGPLIERVHHLVRVTFGAVPGFPASSISGHRGALTLGEWVGKRVLVSEGRLHYYEGHSPEVIARPILLAARLGAPRAMLTNAAGGIREDLGPGSLMPIRGLIEWNRPEAWRSPPPANPCDPHLLADLLAAGAQVSEAIHPGTYAAVRGPTYETPAEVRALREAGADAVGMSTNFELHAGHEAGLACAAVSLITNRAAGLGADRLDHQDVLGVARQAADRLADLIEALLIRIG